jgi:hypothetical protein
MANIRDFQPGVSEQRGAITVQRFADPMLQFSYDHDEFWRFGIDLAATDASKPAEEVWLRLHRNAIEFYGDDATILSAAAIELQRMAIAIEPAATLPDGRVLAGLKPEDLYAPPAPDA